MREFKNSQSLCSGYFVYRDCHKQIAVMTGNAYRVFSDMGGVKITVQKRLVKAFSQYNLMLRMELRIISNYSVKVWTKA
ncbi:hypothetical protein VspSTUT11_24000 [Vibrio sp. STUT-A11]|nr:hypothetical protein VspSTUT11_24000 [Vibrio sp. STUT-A11]